MKKKYITIDLINVDTPYELIGAFVDAKVDNKEPIFPYELKVYADWNYRAGKRDGEEAALWSVISDGIDLFYKTVDNIEEFNKEYSIKIVKKKDPWYKRLWRWIKK